jgi:thiol:disulfide interchange protein DsbD
MDIKTDQQGNVAPRCRVLYFVVMKLVPALRRPVVLGGALFALVFLAAGTAHAETFAEAAARGVGPMFFFAFTTGFLTSLTGCVYPMIPITISIFGGKGVSRGRAFALATAYVAGMATMYGSLGTTVALLGKAFGTTLANPWVVVPIALLFAAMGASLFGAFEISLPQGLQQRLNKVGGRGFSGAFLMGLVGGIIASPCSAPPLVGMLAHVALTRNAVEGFLLLSTHAAGIGVLFWVLAAFSMSLPRSGAWMDSVKSVLGVALLVASLYYLKNVVPALARLTGSSSSFLVLCLVMVAAGVAIGAIHLTFHDSGPRKARKAVGIALVTLGAFAFTNFLLTPKIELRWLHSEPEALATARSSGRPMLVDFGAQWCIPCKELEAKVFGQPEVAKVMSESFTLLRVDCDREDDDPGIGKIRERYQAGGLPAVRVVSAQGEILARLDDANITPQGFVKLLAKAVNCAKDEPAATGPLVDCRVF